MISRKRVTLLFAGILAQVSLLIVLMVTPVYAQASAYCTRYQGGCATYGCDAAGCWGTPCQCNCMCCVDGECVSGSPHDCEPRLE